MASLIYYSSKGGDDANAVEYKGTTNYLISITNEPTNNLSLKKLT